MGQPLNACSLLQMKCQNVKKKRKKKKEKDEEQTRLVPARSFSPQTPVSWWEGLSLPLIPVCLSPLVSLRVWLLSANPFNLRTLRLELALRPGRAPRAVFRRGRSQVCREGPDSVRSPACLGGGHPQRPNLSPRDSCLLSPSSARAPPVPSFLNVCVVCSKAATYG